MALDEKQPGTGEVTHEMLVFERFVCAAVDQVFAAFADPVIKSQWSAPSDTAIIIFDTTDFREGGIERCRCGSRSNPNIYGTTHYHRIVPNSSIVATEAIDVDGKRLCASLTTLELIAGTDDKCRLRLTSQVASFIGQDMIRGHESGNNASLDNLCRYCETQYR